MLYFINEKTNTHRKKLYGTKENQEHLGRLSLILTRSEDLKTNVNSITFVGHSTFKTIRLNWR